VRRASRLGLTAAFEDHTFSLATYAYDAKRRRIESVRRMGQLSEERVTFRYDDYHNPVEQVRVDLSRDMRYRRGAVKVENTPSHVQHIRFEYQYDSCGNWTEQVVWQRTGPDADDRRARTSSGGRSRITVIDTEAIEGTEPAIGDGAVHHGAGCPPSRYSSP
jgi:hypothetical protein